MTSEKQKLKKEKPKPAELSPQNSASSDKLTTLKAYRRANNLCFTCGEKWTGRNHKCPTQVPLHIIESASSRKFL